MFCRLNIYKCMQDRLIGSQMDFSSLVLGLYFFMCGFKAALQSKQREILGL